ncbi:MAG: helix-turn-helix domain-containing protein [Odoribacter sp.]|nr:helix-turn-helix domain-containing protein [Odoribacter sp.]
MKSDLDKYIVRKVKEIRERGNMSIRYFADCLNISESYIRRCESETSDKKYNLNHLNKIAKFFDCTLWEIIPQKPL